MLNTHKYQWDYAWTTKLWIYCCVINRQHDGLVVTGSSPGRSLSLWGLHVVPVPAWVCSGLVQVCWVFAKPLNHVWSFHRSPTMPWFLTGASPSPRCPMGARASPRTNEHQLLWHLDDNLDHRVPVKEKRKDSHEWKWNRLKHRRLLQKEEETEDFSPYFSFLRTQWWKLPEFTFSSGEAWTRRRLGDFIFKQKQKSPRRTGWIVPKIRNLMLLIWHLITGQLYNFFQQFHRWISAFYYIYDFFLKWFAW